MKCRIPRRGSFWSLLVLFVVQATWAEDVELQFERDVAPIVEEHCLKCHGTVQRKGGLSLISVATMLEGGDSGPALSLEEPHESLILEQIDLGTMPPANADRLTDSEIATLRAWIHAGAPTDGSRIASASDETETPIHWAFRPPTRPDVPPVDDQSRVRNPIDAFLLNQLESRGLGFTSEADRITLIRRATFDLWGLPPSIEEIDDFLGDREPDAYERLIDRLLASPRYGERWGRHWLDVAGYADSEGILAADHVRSASWRYRDWVIQAINDDKPYDQFLREQIAGDELVDYWAAYQSGDTLSPEVVDALIATGFLRNAGDTSRPDLVNIQDAPGYYYQTLDDTLTIVASSTLGLTLQCAKCHTHKYDPITQAEYYQVQAVFMSGYRPSEWVPQVERRRLEATAAQEAEAEAHNARIDEAIARRRETIANLTKAFGERRFEQRLANLPAPIRDDVRGAFAVGAEERDEIQRYLFGKFEADLRPNPEALAALIAEESPCDRDLIASLEASNAEDEARRQTFPEIRAFYDLPGDPQTPILQRGDYRQPGPMVGPGALPALLAPEPFAWSPPEAGAPTSGRRLAFAEWLTQPDHPLTARVLVNRLWLHHFGEGIVSTPENFGVKGAFPSHPDLLDWLATEFIAQGASMKQMHRLMMTSTAYRQSSFDDPVRHSRARSLDPKNSLLWRQRLRRLEAEALRDSVLKVSGTLNPSMGGPPVPVTRSPGGEIIAPENEEGRRRSIYLQVRRSQPLTFLQVFDQPVMETNCTQRSVSTVSSQALTLLNSEFLAGRAESFAHRVLRDAPDDPVDLAFRLAFGRSPTNHEHKMIDSYISEQVQVQNRGRADAFVDVCQMLLSSNEFAYID
ncbi:PSD1 and planctomycete cytochrome C domain-containing protein [Tautonia marina]|uniref:PSD1 and planctomycete cytochrome C domain-containing protein n=1 Tax=Tautonia marina TaxID=2653855 RepID=UPI001375A465|nr:PSD1 and planctomycete cytochrome C domain-containing protein [Tautonia marina]